MERTLSRRSRVGSLPEVTPVDDGDRNALVWDRSTGVAFAVVTEHGIVEWDGHSVSNTSPSELGARILSSSGEVTATLDASRCSRKVAAILHDLDFEPDFDEVVVSRGLREPLPSVTRPINLRPGYPNRETVRELGRGKSAGGYSARASERFTQLAATSDLEPRCIVAHADGREVGFAIVGDCDDDGGVGLGLLWVSPKARGQGIGQALHADVLRRLASEGYSLYRDAADTQNNAMLRIFENNGCRKVGVLRHLRVSPEVTKAPR